MSSELVRKWNFTGDWHDQRIEQWLEQMAAQGLHLASVGAWGRYRFRRGAPARVTYRIDVAQGNKIDVDYLQLLTDAGWRMAAEFGNKYYWRNEDAGAPEIFTDGPSRMLKYGPIANVTGLLFLAMTVCVVRVVLNWIEQQSMTMLDKFLCPVWIGLAVYYGYAYLQLKARIRALREAPAL